MNKIGEVRIGVSPCDVCGVTATIIEGKSARCERHRTVEGEKKAGHIPSLSAFTEPIDPLALVSKLQEED